jgi:hypothetical protein
LVQDFQILSSSSLLLAPAVALEVVAMGLVFTPPVSAPTVVSVKKEELDELNLKFRI